MLESPRESIDIWLSHAHLDHVVGLTFLLDTMAVTQLNRVRVYGEARKLASIREHLYAQDIFPVEPRMEFIDLPPEPSTLSISGQRPYKVQWMRLRHPGGSVGFVIEAEANA